MCLSVRSSIYTVVVVLNMSQLDNWRCEGELKCHNTNEFAYRLLSLVRAYQVSVVVWR